MHNIIRGTGLSYKDLEKQGKTFDENETNTPSKYLKSMDTDLIPSSPQEEILWTELEQADRPIVTLLKRINRIVSQQFPQSNVQTEDSCSGHITPDGNLYTEEDNLGSSLEKQKEYHPSIIFETTSQQREPILEYIRSLLKPAVDAVNNGHGQPVLGYDEWIPDNSTHGIQSTRYSIGFNFPVLQKTSAFNTLVDFWSQVVWSQVDHRLSAIDRRKASTVYPPSSFFPKTHK